MKIVFFGTPEYVVPVLDTLHKEFKSKSGEFPIVAVVTQPPKPVGRKRELEYSPVDTWAHKQSLRSKDRKKDIRILRDLDIKKYPKADLGILASYGEIIPKEVINHFPHGILNIHPSLLPAWRGSSPVQAAIVTDTNPTGVSIIKIDEKMDHGVIISQFKEDILPEDTTQTLRTRLFERSAEVLTTLIPAYLQGKITPREQDHKKATFTRQIKKENAFIPPEFLNAALQGQAFKGKWKIPFIKDFDIETTPDVLERLVRAMQPWPGTWTNVRIKNQELRIKILKAHIEKQVPNAQCLMPDLVQLEGKNPVSFQQFLEGYTEAKFV